MTPTLRVCALYPELMNIYADRGNLAVLRARCEWRGLGFELSGVTDDRTEPPLPDLQEIDGTVYHSQVVALRVWPEATRIERVRQTVDLHGNRTKEDNLVTLDRVDAATVAEEAEQLGFEVLETRQIAMTDDYVGSEVVMLCRT